MKISESDVEYVASLAHLEVAEQDRADLAIQLSRILDYVDQLKQLDVSGVEATTPAVESRKNFGRKGRVATRTGSEDAGKTVKLFKVPRMITER